MYAPVYLNVGERIRCLPNSNTETASGPKARHLFARTGRGLRCGMIQQGFGISPGVLIKYRLGWVFGKPNVRGFGEVWMHLGVEAE